MIDLSDGLAGDAWHIAAASRLSVQIDLDSIPVAPEVSDEAARMGVSPQQFAAEGGEDYELLVALPATFTDSEDFVRECGIPITRVGSVRPGSGAVFLQSGRIIELQGFDHFG
jgi:thiamine-monophosphate kinase